MLNRFGKIERAGGQDPRPRLPGPIADTVTLRTGEEMTVPLPGSTGTLTIKPVSLYVVGESKFMLCELALHSLIESGEPLSSIIPIAQRSGKPLPGEATAFRFGKTTYVIEIEFIRSAGDGTPEQRFIVQAGRPQALALMERPAQGPGSKTD